MPGRHGRLFMPFQTKTDFDKLRAREKAAADHAREVAASLTDDAAEQERQRAAKVARIWGEFMQWVQACPGGYYEGCLTCPDYLWHGTTSFFCRKANMAIFGKAEPYVMIINDGGTGGDA